MIQTSPVTQKTKIRNMNPN